jgi:uncharacterized membrane protein
MTADLVEMTRQARESGAGPVTDFWLATVDMRLSRIERMMERLERQVWVLAAVAGGLMMLELLRALIEMRGAA